MDALDRQLALGRAAGLTARQLHAVRALLGVPAGPAGFEALFSQPRTRLESLGISPAASAALQAPSLQRLAADRAWVEREQITLIDAFDARYPPLLAELPDAPALLYVRGEATALASAQLAMVGSRRPTDAGRRTARELASWLAQTGLTITSGLALGVDAAAHEGAMAARGLTIAVLGCGLDVIYPSEHQALAARIATSGALVSEFAPGTPPARANFPRRNRLISGLALGVLVVEAARHSGSLIIARLAAEQGREVFAIPGSIHNPLARGCHALIRGGAKLVENGSDILDELEIPATGQALMFLPAIDQPTSPHPSRLDNDYKILLDALGFEPTSVDLLVKRSGFSSQSVASMLLILELEGAVKLQTDGRYMRSPA